MQNAGQGMSGKIGLNFCEHEQFILPEEGGKRESWRQFTRPSTLHVSSRRIFPRSCFHLSLLLKGLSLNFCILLLMEFKFWPQSSLVSQDLILPWTLGSYTSRTPSLFCSLLGLHFPRSACTSPLTHPQAIVLGPSLITPSPTCSPITYYWKSVPYQILFWVMGAQQSMNAPHQTYFLVLTTDINKLSKRQQVLERTWGNESLHTVGGNANGAVNMEKITELPRKVKHGTSM